MCTFTYTTYEDGIIITSNRDEVVQRADAVLQEDDKYFFMKDPEKGGTWIGCTKQGFFAVLLNGAFEKHVRVPTYRMSRGIILRQCLEAKNPRIFFEEVDLTDIEPFTIIAGDPQHISEFRWTGERKSLQALDPSQSHIYSSVTLYDDTARKERERSFHAHLHLRENAPTAIWSFHTTKDDDPIHGIVIDRPDAQKTISTTQLIIKTSDIVLHHKNHMTDDPIVQKIYIRE